MKKFIYSVAILFLAVTVNAQKTATDNQSAESRISIQQSEQKKVAEQPAHERMGEAPVAEKAPKASPVQQETIMPDGTSVPATTGNTQAVREPNSPQPVQNDPVANPQGAAQNDKTIVAPDAAQSEAQPINEKRSE